MKRNALPYALMFLSGFAGLGYEMVWVRALSAGLGHDIVSVLAVMAAFFVGTAAGAAFYQGRLVDSAFTPTLTRLLIVQALASTAGM